MDEIVKVGTVELYKSEAEKLYHEGKYIVQYNKIFQIMYSIAQNQYGGYLLYRKPEKGMGFTKRGRFVAMTGKQVNEMLGLKLVIE